MRCEAWPQLNIFIRVKTKEEDMIFVLRTSPLLFGISALQSKAGWRSDPETRLGMTRWAIVTQRVRVRWHEHWHCLHKARIIPSLPSHYNLPSRCHYHLSFIFLQNHQKIAWVKSYLQHDFHVSFLRNLCPMSTCSCCGLRKTCWLLTRTKYFLQCSTFNVDRCSPGKMNK